MTSLDSKLLIKTIGRKIFILRQNKGLSREELAYRIGVCQQQLFKYEMGYSRISADRLVMIAEALDTQFYDFWPLYQKKNSTEKNINNNHGKTPNLHNNLSKFKRFSGEELMLKIMALVGEED